MYKITDRILSWIPEENIELEARQQLHNIAEMSFVFKHLAVMPDCHLGIGATVGSVIATDSAIIPAAVGVDIGCGMIAVRTIFSASQLPDDLHGVRLGIERRVPLGAGGSNGKLTKSATARLTALKQSAKPYYDKLSRKWPLTLGSLGSGNHFIELSLDEQDRVWVVLHSGSRGIGNQLANQHIRVAQRLMGDMLINLKDPNLAYLPVARPEFNEYITDLLWSQEFARLNREEMMDRVMTELSYAFFKEDGHQAEIEAERINCHHNFTQQEHHFGRNLWITRKGAIQMRQGQLGVIPGSMGTKSYIVSGLENPLAFHSAPHGAGRRMSRTKARAQFTMEDFEKNMTGIECRHSAMLLDELPGAYKNIDEVMEHSKELVKVEHTLWQIVNVKGD